MVAFANRFNPKISELRHRVALCRMEDVVEKDGSMELSRKEIVWTWAWIMGQQTVPAFITQMGYAAREKLGFERLTHKIMVRASHDIDYTAAAWVYELRRKGPPRWYKSNGFFEYERWVFINCHLQESSSHAQPPVGSAVLQPQPSRIEL